MTTTALTKEDAATVRAFIAGHTRELHVLELIGREFSSRAEVLRSELDAARQVLRDMAAAVADEKLQRMDRDREARERHDAEMDRRRQAEERQRVALAWLRSYSRGRGPIPCAEAIEAAEAEGIRPEDLDAVATRLWGRGAEHFGIDGAWLSRDFAPLQEILRDSPSSIRPEKP